MKHLIHVIIGLISACAGLPHASADVPAVDKTRTVVVDGPIMQGNILKLVPPLYQMAAASSDPINIVFDSPGGEVNIGQIFINEIRGLQSRGVTVRCYAAGMAASMAFQIMANCSERYTLDRAMLLWHRVAIGGVERLTGPEAARLARDLLAIDNMTLRELKRTMGIPFKTILFHFNAQTLHFGENLERLAPDFIESAPAIDGLLDALHDPKVPHMPKPQNLIELLFGGQAKPGEILYIWRGALPRS